MNEIKPINSSKRTYQSELGSAQVKKRRVDETLQQISEEAMTMQQEPKWAQYEPINGEVSPLWDNQLPTEVFFNILSYLPLKDLMTVEKVNSKGAVCVKGYRESNFAESALPTYPHLILLGYLKGKCDSQAVEDCLKIFTKNGFEIRVMKFIHFYLCHRLNEFLDQAVKNKDWTVILYLVNISCQIENYPKNYYVAGMKRQTLHKDAISYALFHYTQSEKCDLNILAHIVRKKYLICDHKSILGFFDLTFASGKTFPKDLFWKRVFYKCQSEEFLLEVARHAAPRYNNRTMDEYHRTRYTFMMFSAINRFYPQRLRVLEAQYKRESNLHKNSEYDTLLKRLSFFLSHEIPCHHLPIHYILIPELKRQLTSEMDSSSQPIENCLRNKYFIGSFKLKQEVCKVLAQHQNLERFEAFLPELAKTKRQQNIIAFYCGIGKGQDRGKKTVENRLKKALSRGRSSALTTYKNCRKKAESWGGEEGVLRLNQLKIIQDHLKEFQSPVGIEPTADSLKFEEIQSRLRMAKKVRNVEQFDAIMNELFDNPDLGYRIQFYMNFGSDREQGKALFLQDLEDTRKKTDYLTSYLSQAFFWGGYGGTFRLANLVENRSVRASLFKKIMTKLVHEKPRHYHHILKKIAHFDIIIAKECIGIQHTSENEIRKTISVMKEAYFNKDRVCPTKPLNYNVYGHTNFLIFLTKLLKKYPGYAPLITQEAIPIILENLEFLKKFELSVIDLFDVYNYQYPFASTKDFFLTLKTQVPESEQKCQYLKQIYDAIINFVEDLKPDLRDKVIKRLYVDGVMKPLDIEFS